MERTTVSRRVVVSVLLPVRDAGDTVIEALESVLVTPHVPLEVVVVDDGSRDDTREQVLGAASRDARVRVLFSEGRGIVAALNQGLRACSGDFVARMDADDVGDIGRLGAQLDRFQRDTGERLGALGTRVAVFGAAASDGFQRFLSWQNSLLTPAEHARDLFIDAPLCHPSVMLRTTTLRSLGGYREGDFAEDYDLFMRLHRAGLWLEKLPEVLLRWRRHDRQTTFTDARLAPDRMRTLKAEHLAVLLASLHEPNRPQRLVLWGAGRDGRRFSRALHAEGQRVDAFVDVDPQKVGRTVHGVPVLPIASLRVGHDRVIAAVGAAGARALIRAHLLDHGFREGSDFFCVA